MYKTILLALDTSPSDRPIIDHIKSLASAVHSNVVLLHVATSAQAKWLGSDAAGQQVTTAQSYLANVQRELQSVNIPAEIALCFGEPPTEIVKYIETHDIDLVAMGTHGHRLLGDILHGFTASKVQHRVSVPVLLLRAR